MENGELPEMENREHVHFAPKNTAWKIVQRPDLACGYTAIIPVHTYE